MSNKVNWGAKPPRDPERADFSNDSAAQFTPCIGVVRNGAATGFVIPAGRTVSNPVRNSADALRFGLVIRANRVVGVIVQQCAPPVDLGLQPTARKQYEVIHSFSGSVDRDLHVDTGLAKRWKCHAVLGVLDWLRSDAVKQMTAAPKVVAWLTLEAE